MRKKMLTGYAAALAGVLGLTACSGGSTSGDGGASGGERSTITLWMYPVVSDENASRDYWAGVEKDFEAANADVNLVVELLPWDGRDEKIATAIASGTGPDLVLLTPDMTLNYQRSGGLNP